MDGRGASAGPRGLFAPTKENNQGPIKQVALGEWMGSANEGGNAALATVSDSVGGQVSASKRFAGGRVRWLGYTHITHHVIDRISFSMSLSMNIPSRSADDFASIGVRRCS